MLRWAVLPCAAWAGPRNAERAVLAAEHPLPRRRLTSAPDHAPRRPPSSSAQNKLGYTYDAATDTYTQYATTSDWCRGEPPQPAAPTSPCCPPTHPGPHRPAPPFHLAQRGSSLLLLQPCLLPSWSWFPAPTKQLRLLPPLFPAGTTGGLGDSDSKVGWCPSGTPLPDAFSSLITLDLSDNGFMGAPGRPPLRPPACGEVGMWAGGGMGGVAGLCAPACGGAMAGLPPPQLPTLFAALAVRRLRLPPTHVSPMPLPARLLPPLPAGLLPDKWPIMFPNLQFLMLANNELWSYGAPTKGRPAALSKKWTQSTYPVAFPALSALYLYPGNDNVCNLPQTTGFQMDGFAPVNTGEQAGGRRRAAGVAVRPGASAPMGRRPRRGKGGSVLCQALHALMAASAAPLLRPRPCRRHLPHHGPERRRVQHQ